jgi:hypothetical protein
MPEFFSIAASHVQPSFIYAGSDFNVIKTNKAIGPNELLFRLLSIQLIEAGDPECLSLDSPPNSPIRAFQAPRSPRRPWLPIHKSHSPSPSRPLRLRNGAWLSRAKRTFTPRARPLCGLPPSDLSVRPGPPRWRDP